MEGSRSYTIVNNFLKRFRLASHGNNLVENLVCFREYFGKYFGTINLTV